MNTTVAPAPEVSTKPVKVDFGTGLLPSLAMELYRDLQSQLQIPAEKAEKIARSFMADYGRILANDADVKYKVGKANDNGECTLALAAKSIKKVTVTKPLSLARLCTELYKLRKEGILGRISWEDVLPSDGENSLYDYVDKL